MKEKNNLHLKSGKDSTNIQIAQLNTGLSYKDARDLCIDLIYEKLDTYKQEAGVEAKKREEKLRTDFLNELEKNKISLDEFKSPSMQLCYVEAQKGYISYGDDVSEKLLIELLKDRMNEHNKSILQISLNEAVKIVPLLMKKHLNLLSLIFFIKEMNLMGIKTREQLIDYIRMIINTFNKDCTLNKVDYEHLQYNKCINTIEIVKSDALKIIFNKYKYYFLNNISLSNFKIRYPKLIKYVDSLNLFKVDCNDMINFTVVDSFISYNNMDIISPDDIDEFKKMITDLNMSMDDFEKSFLGNDDTLISFFYTWKDTLISSSNLTTIGKILAMINIKNELDFPIDMSIWI